MKCPNCTGELHQEDYKVVSVDSCDTCMVILLDFTELDQLEDT